MKSNNIFKIIYKHRIVIIELSIFIIIIFFISKQIVPRFDIGIGKGEVGESGLYKMDKNSRAKLQMKEITKALFLYKLDNGHYPSTEQGLQALVEKPTCEPKAKQWQQYLDKVPFDPWGRKYIYVCPSISHSINDNCEENVKYGNYDLKCVGSDGVNGNEDDINN